MLKIEILKMMPLIAIEGGLQLLRRNRILVGPGGGGNHIVCP